MGGGWGGWAGVREGIGNNVYRTFLKSILWRPLSMPPFSKKESKAQEVNIHKVTELVSGKSET